MGTEREVAPHAVAVEVNALMALRARATEREKDIPRTVQFGGAALIDVDARIGVIPARGSRRAILRIGDGAVVRSGSVVYAGSTIGDGLQTGHNIVIREGNRIGSGFTIGHNSVVDVNCTIGDNVHVGAGCHIGSQTTIENGAQIASGVLLLDDPHPGSATRLCARGPVVHEGAQIGANATILPNIDIGANSLVGAGSVVTKNVAPGTVVVGIPARRLKLVEAVRCPLDLPTGGYLSGQPRRHARVR